MFVGACSGKTRAVSSVGAKLESISAWVKILDQVLETSVALPIPNKVFKFV